MTERKTFDVQLVGPGAISGAGKYESPDGRLPEVDDVIPVDDQGSRGRVTDVSPDEQPPIRAEVV